MFLVEIDLSPKSEQRNDKSEGGLVIVLFNRGVDKPANDGVPCNDLYNFRRIGLDFDHMITKIVVGQKIWFCVAYDLIYLCLNSLRFSYQLLKILVGGGHFQVLEKFWFWAKKISTILNKILNICSSHLTYTSIAGLVQLGNLSWWI